MARFTSKIFKYYKRLQSRKTSTAQFEMSMMRTIDIPKVQRQASKLINSMLNLCQTYHQVQMRFLSDEFNLPTFGRLFELIQQVKSQEVEELIQFQIGRGQKITWLNIRYLAEIEKEEPLDILKTLLNLEKDIQEMTLHLMDMAFDQFDVDLHTFLTNRIILRQEKFIQKRANQLRDLMRENDKVIPFLIDKLSIRIEIEELEQNLRSEIRQRESVNCKDRDQEISTI